MTPAEIVISRFGGVRELARLMNKDPSTVWRWQAPVAQGGMGGRIPSTAQARLLGMARERGIPLTADELVIGSSVVRSADTPDVVSP